MNSKLPAFLPFNVIILTFGTAYPLAAQQSAAPGTTPPASAETRTVSSTTTAPHVVPPGKPSDAARVLEQLGTTSSGTATGGGVVGSAPDPAGARPAFDISGNSNGPENVTRDPSQKSIPVFSLDTPMTEPGVPPTLKDVGKVPAIDLDNPQTESVSKPLDKNPTPVEPLDGESSVPTTGTTSSSTARPETTQNDLNAQPPRLEP